MTGRMEGISTFVENIDNGMQGQTIVSSSGVTRTVTRHKPCCLCPGGDCAAQCPPPPSPPPPEQSVWWIVFVLAGVVLVACLGTTFYIWRKHLALREYKRMKAARDRFRKGTDPELDAMVNITFLVHQRTPAINRAAERLYEVLNREFPPRKPRQKPLLGSQDEARAINRYTGRNYLVRPMEERRYDIFLNHCQRTGGDQCKALFELLQKAGLNVWYDNDARDLTAQGMEEGVANSRCLLAFLSDDLMGRPFCNMEQRWGKLYGCSFIGVRETEKQHHMADFDVERKRAPDDLRHILDQVEFIAYRRKGYEADGMVRELVRRARSADNVLVDVDDGGELTRVGCRNLRDSEGECVWSDREAAVAVDDTTVTTENLDNQDQVTSTKSISYRHSVQQLVREIRNSRVLVLLLSRDVMTRPWCLLEIHVALTHGVPIVPVCLEAGSSDTWRDDKPPRWPDDKALRKICKEDKSGRSVQEWLESLPAPPADSVVKAYHDQLRHRLELDFEMVKYDPNAPYRDGMEENIVTKVKVAMMPGRRLAPIGIDEFITELTSEEQTSPERKTPPDVERPQRHQTSSDVRSSLDGIDSKASTEGVLLELEPVPKLAPEPEPKGEDHQRYDVVVARACTPERQQRKSKSPRWATPPLHTDALSGQP